MHTETEPRPGTHVIPDFDNTKIAFANKSNAELNRAYWLFKVISSNFLTRVGPPITNFFMNIGLPIKALIKPTIFDHFCGGESIQDCEKTIEQLWTGKVGSILDYSVEGEEREEVFNETSLEIIRTVRRAAGDERIPLTVFKVTGIGRFALLEKIQAKEPLSAQEQEEFDRVQSRVDAICTAAEGSNVPVMIDAEESWIQDTIDDLAIAAMRRYNRNEPIVYNTYQLYRSDKLASLKADAALAQTDGFILGAKLVRGAYMEKERARAKEKGYPSPIQPDKTASDRDYNEALVFCTEHLDHVAFVAGTHNEHSCKVLAGLMDQKDIPHHHKHVCFSQLLGMSDNLSFNLADAGYRVAKYVPYGPVKAVMPYLFRRAQENTSVAGQTGRELALIIREKKRRRMMG